MPAYLVSNPFPSVTNPSGATLFLEPSLSSYYSNLPLIGIGSTNLADQAQTQNEIFAQRGIDVGSLILQSDLLIGLPGVVDHNKVGLVGHSLGGMFGEGAISNIAPLFVPEPFLSAVWQIDTVVSIAGGAPFILYEQALGIPVSLQKPIAFIRSDDDDISNIFNISTAINSNFALPFPSMPDPVPLVTDQYYRVAPGNKKLLVGISHFSHEDSWSNPIMECMQAGDVDGPSYASTCRDLRQDLRWDIVPNSPILGTLQPTDIYQGRSVSFRRKVIQDYTLNWFDYNLRGNLNDPVLLKPNYEGRGVSMQYDGFQ